MDFPDVDYADCDSYRDPVPADRRCAVQGSARIMPVCLGLGEAAGWAAAQASRADGDVRQVSVHALQSQLCAAGPVLQPEEALHAER